MPSLPFAVHLRTARRFPVSTAFVFTTLVLNLLLLHALSINTFALRSSLSGLCPWSLVTYVFTIPHLKLACSLLQIALFTGWGAAVEGALGSTDYALCILFTVMVTAVSVTVVDTIVLSPAGMLIRYMSQRNVADPADKVFLGYYVYSGVWPVAQAIVLALCRIRGVTTPVGPFWRHRRLTLQEIPLAIIVCAMVLDLLGWLFFSSPARAVYRSGDRTMIDPHGWNCVPAFISLFVAWLFERHVSGTSNTAFTLGAFFYPIGARAAVRWAGEAAMPMPVFASAAATATSPTTHTTADAAVVTLLPGTTAEEAERYRLIAREALSRRLQEQRHSLPATPADGAAAAAAAGNVEGTVRVRTAPTVDGDADESDNKTV
ncbi:hypothetical protein ABL78_2424 [Leptomonas seymouri]|uniref:Uncharacterized protein n=1 Tax=Leptomonas seymouri TaxID=5684 RepID=A0A0N1PEF2_LEPSE|nr:hypothetical protein ABL78_2424 [Leptomonas seymouri]|eukprot:KPI88462.1 hypothetical protein ABL78_2424 [Leptomonas seymouri]